MSFTAQTPQPNLAWQFESSNVDYVTGLAPSNSTFVPTSIQFAPTYVPGIYGQAISFNNQNASATFANSYVTYTLTSDTSNSYSLSCWIKPLHAIPPTINPNYVVLRDTGGYYSIQNFATNSVAGFYANEGVTGGQGTTFSGLLTTGKWDHHCFVLSNVGATSSNTIVTYYFNGTTQASGNVQRTNGFSTFSALDLGYRSGSANSGAWCSIDDLRLFNTALSAAQVQSIYNQQGMPGRGVLVSQSQYIKSATGGDTVQTINGYRIHTFTTVGTSTFTPATSGLVEVLVVAGGGAGGRGIGGGGGAGGIIYQTNYSVAGGTTVTVGNGGNYATNGDGANGLNSVFGSLTAIGGGVGGNPVGVGNGGSGGGARGQTAGQLPGTGTAGQGNAGGNSYNGNAFAGGGGGAGAIGGDANASGYGNGGNGLVYSISGTQVYYAGGGGGGSIGAGSSGTGGLGGGGTGGTNFAFPSVGAANTGGGGGGGSNGGGINAYNPANGGSGIVIVRYPIQVTLTGTPLFSQLSPAATSSAVGAFSLRAVNGTSVRAVQVRNGTTSATQDFYADRLGNLLTAPVVGQSLADWLGGATGYVTTWYDQSGLGNHATQATTANQPVIQRATKGPGYSCLCSGSQFLSYGTTSIFANTPFSVCVALRRSNGNNRNAYGGWGDTNLNVAWNANFLTPADNIQIGNRSQNTNSTIPAWTSAEGPYYITHTLSNNYYANNYVNGAYSAQSNWTLFLSPATTNKAQIGQTTGQGTPNTFYGEIFEFLAFNSSLYDLDGTASINQIYQNQLSYTGT